VNKTATRAAIGNSANVWPLDHPRQPGFAFIDFARTTY
jgi:hypothetical protein